MLRTPILIATLLFATASMSLIGRILDKSNAKTGIFTLSFNSSSILPDISLLNTRTVYHRDILQEIKSKVSSVKGAVETGLPNIVEAPIEEVKKHVPQNFSLGIKESCVGYKYNMSCERLPVHLSDLVPNISQILPDSTLPDTLNKPLQDKLQEIQQKFDEQLQPIERTLTKVTGSYVQDTLFAGLVTLVIIALLLLCAIISGFFSITSIVGKLVVGLRVVAVLGLLCCIILFIPTIVLGLLQKKTQELPSWIELEKGSVGGLCIRALCCAVIMTILAGITSIF